MSMSEYTLTIELEVDADSFEAAVAEGEAILSDPARGPLVWDVADSRGVTRTIDAENVV